MFELVRYDMLQTLRQAFSWATPLLFFVIVVCLFPLALGSDNTLLIKAAPGIIWVAALLSILISIGNLFRSEAQEGFLDLLVLSPHSLTLIVLSKIFSFWLTHCVPLILMSPVLGILLHLNLEREWILLLTLLLGTPVLCLLGAIGAALVIGIRGSGLLLPVLIMPLYIPVLIFGVTSVSTAYPLVSCFAIMGALLLVTLAFAPLLTAVALRIGVNQ